MRTFTQPCCPGFVDDVQKMCREFLVFWRFGRRCIVLACCWGCWAPTCSAGLWSNRRGSDLAPPRVTMGTYRPSHHCCRQGKRRGGGISDKPDNLKPSDTKLEPKRVVGWSGGHEGAFQLIKRRAHAGSRLTTSTARRTGSAA
jgi:hypothetical protein